jgi:diguanylate cyclase (GGDEF)-like protein
VRAQGVADPSRGSAVAVGFPLLLALCTALTVARDGWTLEINAVVVAVMLGACAAAERIALQLGPRTWYTASTPAIVLTALLGGPLAGAAAGIAGQALRTDAVWRRRLAEGGIAGLQGLAAGWCGLVAWPGPGGAMGAAALAMGAAVGVNSVGRLCVMLDRRTTPLLQRLVRGLLVDTTEAVIVMPLLAVLTLTAESAAVLVVTTVLALLGALAMVHRLREISLRELAAEQEIARRDQLTGAPNRRAFEEALVAEHARIVRGGQPAGLFVVDIDRFKAINDRYTHRVGDEVLVEVVNRVIDGLRATDVVARWGGEEITVLAPGIRGRRAVEQFGERIRMLIGDDPLELAHWSVPVTVSVGGTMLDGSLTTAAALDLADRALYEAKRTRDACVVSMPPRLPVRLEPSVGPVRPGERRDDSQAQEDGARDPALDLRERRAASQDAAGGSRHERPRGIAGGRDQHEDAAEQRQLQADRPVRIDELRQEREEEERRLRVQHVDDDSPPEGAGAGPLEPVPTDAIVAAAE